MAIRKKPTMIPVRPLPAGSGRRPVVGRIVDRAEEGPNRLIENRVSSIIRDGRMEFQDLVATHQLGKAQDYAIQWSRSYNESEQKTALAGETSARLPQAIQGANAGEYFAARISGPEPAKSVTVYIRKEPGGIKGAGIDRTW